MQSAFNQLAAAHAQALLGLFGVGGRPEVHSDHPALAWRRSGLMQVTGMADGPGLVAPVALTAAADGALAALKYLAPVLDLPANGALLLGERARLLDLRRQGEVSPNGSCHLLQARDGRIALNLPRLEDWELIPALLGEAAWGWPELARIVAGREAGGLLEQGRLLGLAIALDTTPGSPPPPFEIERLAPPRSPSIPLVIDLSALWAGPLAASLLAACGAQVIKVESINRPDGARAGDAMFYSLLNAGKASVALDFGNPAGIRQLQQLIAGADIIIESSRPRALNALGISAAQEAARGAIWLSITGHGRSGEAANWTGFGDDAAIAGGLGAAMQRGWGAPMFAGDAIADPLTGITAAFTAWAGYCAGGGMLISLALSEVIANACALYEATPVELKAWQAIAEADTQPLYSLRQPAAVAPPTGADTKAVLDKLGSIECPQ
jgi:crotonobetainyl-CoA:carnitine CoA-transferase CaiB-like acyl-CoA transferase